MGTSVRIIVWWLRENGRGVALIGALFMVIVAGIVWMTMRMDSPVELSETLDGTIMSVESVSSDPRSAVVARYQYGIEMADGTYGTAAGPGHTKSAIASPWKEPLPGTGSDLTGSSHQVWKHDR